ncbi:ankyrin repeat domain-containing protein 17-like [Saccostrea cucullata]|uniref:ankyrin repeat domain-containing protein 17-like n=1 Tax=Saccostrea cuccullata TaxID=36930 RepID=UPI002ED346F5
MTDSFMAEDEEMPENITTFKTKYQIRALNWVVAYGHDVLFEFLMDRISLNEIARKEMSLFSSYEQSHLLVLSTFSADSQITKKLIGYLDSNCIDQSPSGKFDPLNIHMCYTPLTAACVGDNSETIDVLLDAGADINKRDDMPEGDTPLTYVAKHGNIKIVEHLIMRNANIDKVNGCNKSPLYCASYFGHVSTVRYLVANKANVNICDAYNQSPLFVAAEKGFIEIVDILVQNGADVTICENNENKTALYQSISKNHLDISMLLLKSSVYDTLLNSNTIDLILREGVDLNVLDNEGRTMLQWAIKKKDIVICKNLIEHGAKVESLLENEIHSLWSHVLMSHNFDDLKFVVKKFGQPMRSDIPWKEFHLSKASAENNFEVVSVLLNLNFSSPYEGQILQELFTIAIHRGNIEFVKKALASQVEIVNKCEPSLSLFGPKNTTPLNIAIQHGHTDIVKYLVENGSYVNMPDQTNKPSFYRTFECRENETVEKMAQNKVNISFPKGFEDEMPLHFAIKNGHTEIVKYLVERGSETNALDFRRNTPLFYALENDKIEIVEFLVGHGAEVNVPDFLNETPLCKASENGQTKIVEFLVGHGAGVNFFNFWKETPLSKASENGHTEIVEFLVGNGGEVNASDFRKETPICKASKNGHTNIFRYLVEHGANVNIDISEGRSLLSMASKNGHTEIVEYLVGNGAEINVFDSRKETPLYKASENGHTKIVEFLVGHGAEVNVSDIWKITPLIKASENGHTEIVEYLVGHGAEVNVSDFWKRTPLCMASENGHINIVEYLVEHGAEVNVSSSGEGTPLYKASKNGHSEIVEFLVGHGAAVNVSDSCNETPLCKASENGHTKIVEYLVEHGAQVNVSDSWNETPLCKASENGHIKIVEYLVGHGAEVNVSDSWNETPLYKASKNGHNILEIVEWFFSDIMASEKVNNC